MKVSVCVCVCICLHVSLVSKQTGWFDSMYQVLFYTHYAAYLHNVLSETNSLRIYGLCLWLRKQKFREVKSLI